MTSNAYITSVRRESTEETNRAISALHINLYGLGHLTLDKNLHSHSALALSTPKPPQYFTLH